MARHFLVHWASFAVCFSAHVCWSPFLLLWLVEWTEIGYARIREGFPFLNMMHAKRDNAWLNAVSRVMRGTVLST